MSQIQLKLVLLQEIRGKSEKVFAVRVCYNLVLVWMQQRQAVSRSVPHSLCGSVVLKHPHMLQFQHSSSQSCTSSKDQGLSEVVWIYRGVAGKSRNTVNFCSMLPAQ